MFGLLACSRPAIIWHNSLYISEQNKLKGKSEGNFSE